ncbi:colipase-like [Pseudophryne corroboree]|uniref:colipase-like n=1 Tax=Pseudophryne corroboree TaxID=495146 RepID=UPI003081497C
MQESVGTGVCILLHSGARYNSTAYCKEELGKQDTGELCVQSAQCKSSCCHRDSGVSLARCAPKAPDNQKCSPLHLYGVYYYCPCEIGLTCEVDRSIVGTITNTDFGYCKDRNN